MLPKMIYDKKSDFYGALCHSHHKRFNIKWSKWLQYVIILQFLIEMITIGFQLVDIKGDIGRFVSLCCVHNVGDPKALASHIEIIW